MNHVRDLHATAHGLRCGQRRTDGTGHATTEVRGGGCAGGTQGSGSNT